MNAEAADEIERLTALARRYRAVLDWIAQRYDDNKTTAHCAADAYAISTEAKAALAAEKEGT